MSATRQPTAAPTPRIALTLAEAATAIGVSESSFRRYILPELRVIQAGPRLTLVRLAELDRFLEQRQALGYADLGAT